MTEERAILLCGKNNDRPGLIEDYCRDCRCAVFRSPSSNKIFEKFPNLEPLCFKCSVIRAATEGVGGIEKLNEEQIKELLEAGIPLEKIPAFLLEGKRRNDNDSE